MQEYLCSITECHYHNKIPSSPEFHICRFLKIPHIWLANLNISVTQHYIHISIVDRLIWKFWLFGHLDFQKSGNLKVSILDFCKSVNPKFPEIWK